MYQAVARNSNEAPRAKNGKLRHLLHLFSIRIGLLMLQSTKKSPYPFKIAKNYLLARNLFVTFYYSACARDGTIGVRGSMFHKPVSTIRGLCFYNIVALCIACFWYGATAAAQDITELGGALTSYLPGRAAIQVNAPNVTDETRRVKQLTGFGMFHGEFNAKSGLGPLFNNNSCAGCHVNNGRGQVLFSEALNLSRAIVKVALRGRLPNGAPRPIPGIGNQLHDHSTVTNDPRTIAIKIAWLYRQGSFPDGTKYTLRKPAYSFRIPGYRKDQILSSLRATPPVIGPGLLESIPEADILALSDPNDTNKDGISGRPQYVAEEDQPTVKLLGRFGFKATSPTVADQTAVAFIRDMGLGTKIYPTKDGKQEISDADFENTVLYQTLAGVPPARNQDDPAVIAGKNIFKRIGCDGCHTMTHVTVSATDPELDNQTIHPFTDLLLHDMGPDLADSLPMFRASASEWRTAPLWGLGFSLDIASGGRVGFLHDGRARTIQEAILWHGGEAERSKRRFMRLRKTDRAMLLRFLRSL